MIFRFKYAKQHAAIVGAVLITALLWGTTHAYRTHQASNPLPEDQLESVAAGWVDEHRCAECHIEAESFWETGHANTLISAEHTDSVDLLESLNRFLEAQDRPARIEFRENGIFAIDTKTTPPREVQLSYCLGSGEHARTWVGMLTDSQGATELLEFRWTNFHGEAGFALTPGQSENPLGGYYSELGLLFDAPKARKCISCHASSLTIDNGRIDIEKVHASVTCQRCHGSRAEHVASDGEIKDEFWQNATQMESINRCAECHRRADEQAHGEVRPDNKHIVRFQPVGLIQSPCFKHSEMTCMTCHDPHRTLEAQNSLGAWQCFQCHAGADQRQTDCSAGHFDQCVKCHMPKVEQDAPVKFTDHWIRVRHDVPAQEINHPEYQSIN